MLNPIISGTLLNQGDEVAIARAYHFILKSGKHFATITKIPFEYKPAKDQILVKEHSYPLSYVLCPRGTGISVSELTKTQDEEYTFLHSKAGLEPVIKEIVKNLADRNVINDLQ